MRRLLFMGMVLFLWCAVLATAGAFSDRLEGKIAYIGMDNNVYTYFDGVSYALTADGSDSRRYQWLTWSPDDQLAYFCCNLDMARNLQTGAYLSDDGLVAGREVWKGFGQAVIYAAWSPAPCEGGHVNCRLLSMLVNDALQGGMSVEMISEEDGIVQQFQIGVGAPFYYSFNASGNQLLLHRNNRDMDVYNIATRDIVTERTRRSSGTFQTPSWSPIDNRLVIGTRGTSRQTTNITVINELGELQEVIRDIRGNLSFLWSPDGRYIAYRSIANSGISELFVVDIITGELVAKSPVDRVIAFFWSPDSRYLAYVTPYRVGGGFSKTDTRATVQQRQRTTLSWSILDVVENNSFLLTAFVPTYEMTYLLTYFDQFAQSHAVWSPNSQYIVYSEWLNDAPAIQVVDVLRDTVPITIANGTYAVWSFK